MTLDPAVAEVRRLVRAVLSALEPGSTILIACSGGADSLALAAATVIEAKAIAGHVIGVTIDHGLQPDSSSVADHVVSQLAALGCDETYSARVRVEPDSALGPEAAARTARYAVLEEIAERTTASVVLLGHTRDDQAETVLLGLARGSGGRSIAGMRRSFGPFRRPLLDTTRAQTQAACAALAIEYWIDPHNADPRFARARVRHQVLPALEAELGPGVAAALARTADQLRADSEFLDELADSTAAELGDPAPVGVLTELHPAIRRRVLRLRAVAAGSPPSELTAEHVYAVERLITAWRGQHWVDLPGPVRARRTDERIRFEAVDSAPSGP